MTSLEFALTRAGTAVNAGKGALGRVESGLTDRVVHSMLYLPRTESGGRVELRRRIEFRVRLR